MWLGKEKDGGWFASTVRETLDKSVKSGFADMVNDFGGFVQFQYMRALHV